MTDQQIKDILLSGNYVSKEDLEKAEDFVASNHGSITDYLIEKAFITKDIFGQAVAEFFEVKYADLNSYSPASEQIHKIPENIARKFRIVLFEENEEDVVLATDVLLSKEEKVALDTDLGNIFLGKKIVLAYSLAEDIDNIFVSYQKALETRFAKIIKDQMKVAPEIISEIFDDAFIFQASDVHFEPQEKEVLVRFRVDGVLHEAGRIPKEYYENIINRVKVLAHLRIDEHFSAQDGAIRYTKSGRPYDMRVSIIPTMDGEKIAIRILAGYVKSYTLADIGLSSENEKLLRAAAQKPFGMILVSGPTGSGKTTTLYAILKLLNNSGINITTIEDPVEYKLIGINQIQVNAQTNLTFANGLRSIVRQDPDVVLVGEIRDRETAEIAVNAALTGHLLLSTFHANDAATSIPRLLDMGVEPFLLASTMELIIAQRLVRKICEKCRTSYSEDLSAIKSQEPAVANYFTEKKITFYKGKGCHVCGGTGYKGRTAIFEFIYFTPKMKELILKDHSSQQIWELAKKQGSLSLFDDGMAKVKSGVTTIEELLRVASPS